MTWVGKSTISRHLGGRTPAGDVRIGDYVMPREAWWTVEGSKGSPDLRMRFEVREGRPQCVEVHVEAKPDGRPVRTSDLQVLSLDAATISVFSSLALRSSYDPETNVTTLEPIGSEREFWHAVNAADAAVKAPRRGTTRAELEQVAKVYRDNISGRPVESVRVTMGYGSERTAARRVEQARAAGLLPATTPGKKKG